MGYLSYFAKQWQHFIEFAISFGFAERFLGMCVLIEELFQCGQTHLNTCIKQCVLVATSIGITRTRTGIATSAAAATRCIPAAAASVRSAATQLAHNVHI